MRIDKIVLTNGVEFSGEDLKMMTQYDGEPLYWQEYFFYLKQGEKAIFIPKDKVLYLEIL
ncbi:hypothetical protein Q5O24_09075 [Eubacteriaceae bacterium ES3]|nr:hypothetical protein Q5O24_09075 [Eubacteriaceae bacterium ES3]